MPTPSIENPKKGNFQNLTPKKFKSNYEPNQTIYAHVDSQQPLLEKRDVPLKYSHKHLYHVHWKNWKLDSLCKM